MDTIPIERSSRSEDKIKKPCWKKATTDEKQTYTYSLEEKLSKIQVPGSLCCANVKCHSNDADTFITGILECVQSAASSSLPSSSSSKSSSSSSNQKLPGWKDFVKPFRDDSYFWHQIWTSAGKPINIELQRITKRTRNMYHYQYRKTEGKIVKNKLVDACINGNGDIFKEIKKIHAAKPAIATSMDGTKENIAGHFQEIYSELYNSVDYHEELVKITIEAESQVNLLSYNDVEKVTPEIVKEAASHLKDSKSDPTYTFNSDCIKNGSEQFFSKLSIALRSFFVHWHATLFLLLATLVPIIKNKQGSKNYHSIAVCSLVLKLLDWIILIIFGDVLGVDQL